MKAGEDGPYFAVQILERAFRETTLRIGQCLIIRAVSQMRPGRLMSGCMWMGLRRFSQPNGNSLFSPLRTSGAEILMGMHDGAFNDVV